MMIDGISNPALLLTPTETGTTSEATGQFGELLGRAIASLNQLQQAADAAALDVATGGPTELHEAMIAAQEAQIGFQLALQVRNKIVESYQEIMRMQI